MGELVVPPDVVAALDSGSVRLPLCLRLRFKAGDVRVWTGHGDIEIDGEVWRGAGVLSDLPELEQLLNGEASRMTLEASGVDQRVMGSAVAEADEVEGRDLEIGFVVLDGAGQVIGGLQALDTVVMDRVTVDRQGGTGGALRSVALEASSPLAARSTPGRAYYTDRDQQRRHPGDLGCERATLEVILKWPTF